MEKKNRTLFIVECALFAAVLCVFSPITIPIGPIPISLGIFAVMLTGVVLGAKMGIVSVAVYILIGVLGLPLFSGGKSGIAALMGPTGGYVWSYVLMVVIIGLISKIKANNKAVQFIITLFGIIVGTAVCYVCGTLQYSLIADISFIKALSVCVIPFIVFDAAKAVCAALLGTILKNVLKKSGYLY